MFTLISQLLPQQQREGPESFLAVNGTGMQHCTNKMLKIMLISRKLQLLPSDRAGESCESLAGVRHLTADQQVTFILQHVVHVPIQVLLQAFTLYFRTQPPLPWIGGNDHHLGSSMRLKLFFHTAPNSAGCTSLH